MRHELCQRSMTENIWILHVNISQESNESWPGIFQCTIRNLSRHVSAIPDLCTPGPFGPGEAVGGLVVCLECKINSLADGKP